MAQRKKAKDVDPMGVVVPLRPTAHGVDRPGGEASDGELVLAARDGAAWAKEALYRRHVRMATGLAHRVLPRSDEVDDLVQDAYLAAFKGLGRLEDPQAFAKFLGSIVIRTARRRIRHRSMLRRIGFGRAEPIEVDRVVSRSAPPDVGAELRTIYALLESLPTDVRIALVLRRVEGMSIPEIADHMQISPATVKRRISAGEVTLRGRLSRGQRSP